MLLIILLGQVIVAGVFVFVMLFGDSAAFRGTIVQSCYNFLTGQLIHGIKVLFCGFMSPKTRLFFENMEDYCCWSKNPILQTVYLGTLFGIFYAFHEYGYYQIGCERVPEYHRIGYILSFSFAIMSFILACRSSAGAIDEGTIETLQSIFPYDNLTSFPRFCNACKLIRPARSRHCYMCGKCIPKFDHHCGWINTCVGYQNLKYFLWFLFVHAVILTYGCYIGVMLIMQFVDDSKILNAHLRDTAGKIIKVDTSILFQYILFHRGPLFAWTLMCGLLAFVLICFYGIHLSQVLRNVTTYEKFKWEYISQRMKGETNLSDDSEDESSGDSNQPAKAQPKLPDDPNKVVNIYNLGILSNIKEVVFPVSLEETPKSRPPRKAKQS